MQHHIPPYPMPTIHARIYDPTAEQLRTLAESNRRPVSTEVQIAVETHLKKPRKKKGAK